MSYDMAFWYPRWKFSNAQAQRIYSAICGGKPSGLKPNPAVSAFYSELTKQYPEIGAETESENCPWTARLDCSDEHVLLFIRFSWAKRLEKAVADLAQKHGLCIYDPQRQEIFYSDSALKRFQHMYLLVVYAVGFLFLAAYIAIRRYA